MPDSAEQVLSDAVARNLGAVLSLPSAGMLRHYKSRFLAETPEGIWIESAAEDRMLIEELIARKQPAAVSFKSATMKTSFAATLLRRDEQYQINSQTVVEAVLFQRPANVNVVQRRNDYRVRINEFAELTARVWRIAERANLEDRPSDLQEVKIHLRDVSLGGMGITVFPPPPDAEATVQKSPLMMDERLRIELSGSGEKFLIEGRVRHLPRVAQPDATKPTRVGVQFKKLESDLNGRQSLAALTRWVGQLQREEVRRMRLGMVTPDAA